MKTNRGLAFKLSTSILVVVLLIMASMLYYNYIISRDRALDDAIMDAQKLTELTVSQIESVLNAVEYVPENLASVIEHRDTVRFIGTRKVMENLLESRPLIYGASIAFAPRINDGDTFYHAPYIYSIGDTIVFKDLALDNYNYYEKKWYIEAKNKGIGLWSEPYFDEGGGEALMATYSVPFYRDYGSGRVFSGVVTADISLANLQELIHDIQFYNTGKGFLISSTGNIVTYPELEDFEGEVIPNIFNFEHSAEMLAVLKKMTSGESGILSLKNIAKADNADNWISFAVIPSSNWSLGILFEEKELYVGIHDLFIRLIAIGLGGMALLVILVIVIARRIVDPLGKLASATRKIGAGDFDFRVPSYASSDEIGQLGRSFNLMQMELKEYVRNLRETTAEKEKMESELLIASNIQQQMLSKATKLPGKELDFFGVIKPARMVGGDLYDFIARDNYLYFAVGDVSGKGIPAALFMAKTLTLFRAKVSKGKEPGELASELNRDLEQYNAESMFVTLFIGKLDTNTGELSYTNAGHNLPYLCCTTDSSQILSGTHGLPLGSLPEQDYSHAEVTLARGEKIVLYTDGVTEAVNPGDELFGDNRLKELITTNAALAPQKLAEHIISEVDIFASGAEQADDITLFILEYK